MNDKLKELLQNQWVRDGLVAAIAAGLGGLAVWLGLDVQAICEAVLK